MGGGGSQGTGASLALSPLPAAVTLWAGLREEVVLGDKPWFGSCHIRTTCSGARLGKPCLGSRTSAQAAVWGGLLVGEGGVLGDSLGDHYC